MGVRTCRGPGTPRRLLRQAARRRGGLSLPAALGASSACHEDKGPTKAHPSFIREHARHRNAHAARQLLRFRFVHRQARELAKRSCRPSRPSHREGPATITCARRCTCCSSPERMLWRTCNSRKAGPNAQTAHGEPMNASDAESECGAAKPNPYGLKWGTTVADGDCQVCSAPPAVLPACTSTAGASALSWSAIKNSVGKRVRLIGTVAIPSVHCNFLESLCACSGTISCSAPLLLVSTPTSFRRLDEDKPTPQLMLDVSAPSKDQDSKSAWADYVSPRSDLFCWGDEASLCCPFELEPKTRSVDVIAEGVVRLEPSPGGAGYPDEYHLALDSVCKRTSQ